MLAALEFFSSRTSHAQTRAPLIVEHEYPAPASKTKDRLKPILERRAIFTSAKKITMLRPTMVRLQRSPERPREIPVQGRGRESAYRS